MGDKTFIWEYVRSCASGNLASTDCGPLWQFGAMVVLLVFAIVAFLVLVIVRARAEARVAVTER